MSHKIPARIVSAVDERDGLVDALTGRYIGAGRNLHHRKLLSRGGIDAAENLVTLSGSGTTGSHGWVHANPAKATRLGLIIPGWVEAETVQDVPVRISDITGRLHWALLRPDNTGTELTEIQAERILLDLGIWQSVTPRRR